MILRPICEPVELPVGASLIAERVAMPDDAPASGRFLHFHDVAELVLFRKVRGDFIGEGQSHRLGDGAVTFVPSMRHHDFALDPGAKAWVLVQIDPYLVESLTTRPEFKRLSRPFCAWPDAASQSRIDMLGEWLVEAAAHSSGSSVETILELLLLLAAQAPESEAAATADSSSQVERLLPALEHLRSRPADQLQLESAAALCQLTPPYFSRLFRQKLGMTFTEYVRTYRLNLAARRLLATGASVSEIAYGVGFQSPAHFTARFRERFGMTPRDYRNSARNRVAS